MAEHAMYFADEKSRKQYMTRQVISKVFVYLFLTIFALFLVTPFIIMIIGSFIDPGEFKQFSETGIISHLAFKNWDTTNYKTVFAKEATSSLTGEEIIKTGYNFGAYFLNTFIVAVGSTTVTVITAVLAAFAFARLEFKGKEALFGILLGTMMIPGEMMVITNYMTVLVIDWRNTFAALILVHGVSVFYVFYLRQTFQQIPNELYLAAKVDGVGDIGYLLKVMVPIAMPTITTIIILSMMGAWNSYVWPQLVTDNEGWKYSADKNNPHTMMLVSNGLRSLFAQGDDASFDAIKLAGSMVISMPLFVVFICFRKYIMRGVSRSGIKG